MASPPVTAPSQNNSSSSGNTNSSSSEAHPPSSSPKNNSSPPPASPPPPAKKSPSPPPPKASSPPPPASSPSPKHSSPSPSSPPPPPQQKNNPPSSPPPPAESNTNTPEQKSHPPPPPAATKNPSTPATPPSGTFYPPPPSTTAENAAPPGSAAMLAPPLPPGNEGSNITSSSSSGSSSSASSDRPPAKSNGSSSPTTKTTPSSQHTTTIAIVAGVGVAVGILIIALAIFCIVCGRKKKRKLYYMDPGVAPPPGNDYYNPASAQWNSPQDHVIRLTPPPGMMGTPDGPGGGGGWGHQGPPCQLNTSKDFSAGATPPPHVPLSPGGPNMALGFSKSQFTYEELATATGGFSKANLLGQGGFGYVHKGVLPNGQEVAVKSLKTGSGQGEREFQAEVEIISRVHHRHLVSLVGYCIADEQRMLVYEFVPNKTMEFHLHGKNQPVMDWSTRLRIALGSAKGLGYLHEDCHPKIIHRDIKAANILLDNNFEAMVADFGLAKLSSDNYTHISTRVMGTFGYMAPEYASSGKLTDKSDVFSFGVMLLELITGRRPLDLSGKYMEEDSLVDWARPLLTKAIEDDEYKELVDPRLGDNYNPQEMARMVACASASIRHSARRRPKMSQIVRALDGDSSLDDLNDGGKGRHGANNGNTETYDTNAYNADMMKFRQMVMTSQDFTSGEYSGTSDYGHNPSSSSSEYSREMDGHSGYARRKL